MSIFLSVCLLFDDKSMVDESVMRLFMTLILLWFLQQGCDCTMKERGKSTRPHMSRTFTCKTSLPCTFSILQGRTKKFNVTLTGLWLGICREQRSWLSLWLNRPATLCTTTISVADLQIKMGLLLEETVLVFVSGTFPAAYNTVDGK